MKIPGSAHAELHVLYYLYVCPNYTFEEAGGINYKFAAVPFNTL